MKYFHLTPEKQPRGPYSAAEMRALHASGVINDDTYAAAAGDANWRPYRELRLDADDSEAAPTEPQTLGSCPFCRQDIIGTETPAVCPHCAATLHPGTGNLWGNFLSCMRRYACFRGRATRTEYWSFYLFYLIISSVAEQVWKSFLSLFYDVPADLQDQVKMAGDLEDILTSLSPHAEAILMAVCGQFIIAAALWLPYMAVTVRRLHDTGRSAAVLLWYFGGAVLVGGGLLWFAFLLYTAGLNEEVFALLCENDSILPIAVGAMAAGMVIFLISALYLFICTLLPTKKGANKYGPSSM